MIDPSKSNLSNRQLHDFLTQSFPFLEIELEWDYSDEGYNQGTYQSNDYLIECTDFTIQTELFIQEEGETTPETYLQPSEYHRNSLEVEIGRITLVPDDCSEVVIDGDQYQILKNKILNEIKKAL